MTVVAGLVDRNGGGVWIGADSAAMQGDGRVWTISKIARQPVGDAAALLGITGDHRLVALARSIEFPEGGPDPSSDADCDGWAQAVADAFTDQALEAKPPVTSEGGLVDGYAMLGHAGRLWVIFTSLAVRIERHTAIGSGGEFATGALDALHVTASVDPERSLRIACQSACRHNDGCRPPIHVEHVTGP